MKLSKQQRAKRSAAMKAHWAAKRAAEGAQAVAAANDAVEAAVTRKAGNAGGDAHYTALSTVLLRAYEQASTGKGAERHAQNLPFGDQPMQQISVLLGTERGMMYQAVKKVQEASRLPTEAAVHELLGAINYLAGAVIFLEASACKP